MKNYVSKVNTAQVEPSEPSLASYKNKISKFKAARSVTDSAFQIEMSQTFSQAEDNFEDMQASMTSDKGRGNSELAMGQSNPSYRAQKT